MLWLRHTCRMLNGACTDRFQHAQVVGSAELTVERVIAGVAARPEERREEDAGSTGRNAGACVGAQCCRRVRERRVRRGSIVSGELQEGGVRATEHGDDRQWREHRLDDVDFASDLGEKQPERSEMLFEDSIPRIDRLKSAQVG